LPVWTGGENLAPHLDSIPGPSSSLRVAIPTELDRPTIFAQTKYYLDAFVTRVGGTGHVLGVEEMRIVYGILVEKLKERGWL
jgi:hypothetical protein